MTTAATPHDPADWSDLSKPEYSGRIIEAKIHGPVGNADYMKQEVQRGHQNYVMSRSEMKAFARVSPAEWINSQKDESSDEQQWGAMLDLAVFDLEGFGKRYCTPPATYADKESNRKNAPIVSKPWNPRADICRQWKAEKEATSVTVISHDELAQVLWAKRQLLLDEIIADILAKSRFQVLVTGTYEDFGTELKIPVKGCVDIEPPRDMFPKLGAALGDLKTTQSLAPYLQDKDTDKFWYDSQAVFYCDLYTAAGDERGQFFHVLQKNYGDYATGRRFLTEECLRKGREKYHAAMKLYCQCLKEDFWPSYEQMETRRMKIDGFLATEPTNKPNYD